MGSNWRILREEGRFRRLLAAGFINGIGDWFNSVAVLSLLLALTGSGMAVGIVLVVKMLPPIILGPYAGVLADRLPHKYILVVADLARVGLALLLLFATTQDRVWVVYVATFGLVLFATLYGPARIATVPGLVRERNLLAANALDQAVLGSVMVVGAVLGGLATAAWGVQVAFKLNALSFLVSVVLTLTIRFPRAQSAVRAARPTLRQVWPVVRASRMVQVILLLAALWPLGGGIINVLISVYAEQVFHAGNVGIGLLYGALGGGFILSSALAPYISARVRLAAAASVLVEGTCYALFGLAPQLALATGFLLLAATGAGLENTCVRFLVMRGVPSALHGRIFALIMTVSNSVMVLSLALTGLALSALSPRVLGVLAGVLVAGAGLLVGALLLRVDQSSDSEVLIATAAG